MFIMAQAARRLSLFLRVVLVGALCSVGTLKWSVGQVEEPSVSTEAYPSSIQQQHSTVRSAHFAQVRTPSVTREAFHWEPPPPSRPPHWLSQFDSATTTDELRVQASRSSPLTAFEEHHPACITELHPSLQIACRHLRLHHRRLYEQSWCPDVSRCVMWGSGTFSLKLDEHQLRKHYNARHAAIVSVARDTDRLRLLLTTPAQLWDFSATFLHRVNLQAEDLRRQQLCLRGVEEDGGGARRHAPDASCQPSELQVDDVFPGCVEQQNACGVLASPQSSARGESDLGHGLSSLDLISMLFHMARRSDDASSPRATQAPLHVLVFSGDSTLRESFLRLVHYIRHAAHPSPFFDLPTWSDIVYHVYADGDSIQLLPSPFSGGRRRFPQVLEHLENENALLRVNGTRRPLLFSLVFLFSKRTSEPRKELWDPQLDKRLERVCKLGLVVEGTLFWEASREQRFLKVWEREAQRRAHGGTRPFPFVTLLGHPKFELCRAGRHALVPRRVHQGSAVTAASVCGDQHPSPCLASVVGRLSDLLRHPLVASVDNALKNVEAVNFLSHVVQERCAGEVRPPSYYCQRNRSALQQGERYFSWDSVHALDKSLLSWMPGLLPIDHIHFSCRMLPSLGRPQDPLIVQPVSTFLQWRVISSRGLASVHKGSEGGWELALDALDALGGIAMPSAQTPLATQWQHAGGKKRNIGRYVHLAVDGHGCLDKGNRILMEALITGLAL